MIKIVTNLHLAFQLVEKTNCLNKKQNKNDISPHSIPGTGTPMPERIIHTVVFTELGRLQLTSVLYKLYCICMLVFFIFFLVSLKK